MRAFLLTFFSFLLLATLPVTAQQSGQRNFMQHLRKSAAGEGRVVVVQDSLIDRAVNNQAAPATKHKTAPSTDKDKAHKDKEAEKDKSHETTASEHHAHESARQGSHVGRQRYKAQGYRIQIFTGSNSHADKEKAYDVARKCQKAFPMLSVYPRFVSPRWICRVGDFRDHDDAQTYARKIRAARIGTEVRVVKCEVLLAH